MCDQSTILVNGGIGSAFTVVTFIVVKLLLPFFTVANHKRIRSVCCGRTCVSSLDVDETTPTATTRHDTSIDVPPQIRSPT